MLILKICVQRKEVLDMIPLLTSLSVLELENIRFVMYN